MNRPHKVELSFEERIKLKKPATAVLLTLDNRKVGIVGYLTGTETERSGKQHALTHWLITADVSSTVIRLSDTKATCEARFGPYSLPSILRKSCPIADNDEMEEALITLPSETMTALLTRMVSKMDKG